MMRNKFLSGKANNPEMTKKQICEQMGLKVGTINSNQNHYNIISSFYYKKPKVHKKKVETRVNDPKKSKKGGRDDNKTVESVKRKIS